MVGYWHTQLYSKYIDEDIQYIYRHQGKDDIGILSYKCIDEDISIYMGIFVISTCTLKVGIATLKGLSSEN